MAFDGWHQVAQNLLKITDKLGQHLNNGQRDALSALAIGLPSHGMMIADEVGMGKTRIAVALAQAVKEANGRVAILVPPTLEFQWREELRHGGLTELAPMVRSLLGFLEAWQPGRAERPWFREPIVLISHSLATWRLGASTARWRFELLPFLAGYAHHQLHGSLPYGFRTMEANADHWVMAASKSIVDFCSRDKEEAGQQFRQLGSEAVWRDTIKPGNYHEGGINRRLLSSSVGLGLGAFDLVIIDEAHKGRRDESGLSNLLERTLLPTHSNRRLCLTATPVELDIHQWKQSLARIHVDENTRDKVSAVIQRYGDAARKVRILWRSSEDARQEYVSAARDFADALRPYVLRRDKRQDDAVALFKAAAASTAKSEHSLSSHSLDPDAYRWERDITVSPASLLIDWRRAICAAEALSFMGDNGDLKSKRLRLTFGNGHGIATQLDQFGHQELDPTLTPDDLAAAGVTNDTRDTLNGEEKSPDIPKAAARATWWKQVIARVVASDSAIYNHPALLSAVTAIETYREHQEKVLVFGRFTEPMRALVDLLNGRAMLRAVDTGALWPQSVIAKDDIAAVRAAHYQLARSGNFDADAINDILAKQYTRLQRRRETLRDSLFDLIETGLSDQETDGRALASAAKADSDDVRALLAAAIGQLLGDDRPTEASSDSEAVTTAPSYAPAVVANAFLSLMSALRERGEGDADGNRKLSVDEVRTLWATISDRLREEYGLERGRFARLMNGATQYSTRRALQLAFNRPQSNPHVIVAQSIVGREGLNLHEACRVVILLHPEWNPGVVEQQIGRVDRVNSHWAKLLGAAVESDTRPLPRIEVRPVIFEGTYDTHHWSVLRERWDDLRAQLHGIVVPFRLREGCSDEERAHICRLDDAAPNFRPPSAKPN